MKSTLKTKAVLFSALMTAAFSSAFAATPAAPMTLPVTQATYASANLSKQDLATLAETVKHEGGTAVSIASTFQGPAGLIGLELNVPNGKGGTQKAFAWITAPDGALIFGSVIKNGLNYTQAAVKHLFKSDPTAKPDNLKTDVKALEDTAFVPMNKMNKPDREVFIVFDPTCPHCHHLYKTVSAMLSEFTGSRIQVNWVPVNVLGGNSTRYGAEILKGGVHSLTAIETPDTRPPFFGEVNSTTTGLIRLNTDLIAKGVIPSGVPSIHWRDKHGESHVLRGNQSKEILQQIIKG